MSCCVTGMIHPVWDMSEVENLVYFSEPFNDQDTYDNWKQYYGYNFSIGEQADYRSSQPSCQTEIINMLEEHIGQLKNVGCSWYRMQPGDMLPYHQDKYVSYCNYYGVEQKDVYRILVLLQDWKPGFLLEVGKRAIADYSAGTYVMWNNDTPHMAGNLGFEPRYTLQITATK